MVKKQKMRVAMFLVVIFTLAVLISAPSGCDKQKGEQASQQDESNMSNPYEEESETPKTITVFRTRTGKKYHRGSCSYLRRSSFPLPLKDAKARGLEPCSRCCPPN